MARPVITWASQIRAGNGKPSKARSRPGLGIFEPPNHWSLSSQAKAECSCRWSPVRKRRTPATRPDPFKPVRPPRSCHAGPPPQVRHGHARSAQDRSTKIFRWRPGAHLRCRNSLKSSPRRPTSHEQARAASRTDHDAALRSIHTLHRRKCSSSLQNCGLGYTYRPKYVERGLDLNQAMSRQSREQEQTFIVHAGQSQRTRFSGCLPDMFWYSSSIFVTARAWVLC